MYTSTNKGRQMLRNQSGGKNSKKRNSKNLKKNQKVKKTRTVKKKMKLKTMKQVDLDIDSKSLVGGKLGTSYMDGEIISIRNSYDDDEFVPVSQGEYITYKTVEEAAIKILYQFVNLMGRYQSKDENNKYIDLENSLCNKNLDQSTFLDHMTYIGQGSFGIGTKYQCPDIEDDDADPDQEYIIKTIMPHNRISDINYEIDISKNFASSNSPFITQFLFALSFSNNMFVSRNQKDNMKLSSLYKKLEGRDTKKVINLLKNMSASDIWEEKLPVGIIAMEKGDNTLKSVLRDMTNEWVATGAEQLGEDYFRKLYNYSDETKSWLYKFAIISFIMEISLGFYYFQKQGYTHGDFKFDNCIYKKVSYFDINSKRIISAVPMIIDLGLLSNNSKSSWKAGTAKFRPENIKNIYTTEIPNEEPHKHDINYDVYTLASSMIYYIWGPTSFYRGMGATCFKDIVDKDSIKYPKYILKVLDNMMNEDSKMRPSFEIIIEKCYTYLDTIKDTNNMFHLDNLCKKYIALRGVIEEGKLYKKNNIDTFNLDNFTPSLLARIEKMYDPEAGGRPSVVPGNTLQKINTGPICKGKSKEDCIADEDCIWVNLKSGPGYCRKVGRSRSVTNVRNNSRSVSRSGVTKNVVRNNRSRRGLASPSAAVDTQRPHNPRTLHGLTEPTNSADVPPAEAPADEPDSTYFKPHILYQNGNKVYQCPLCKTISGTLAVKHPEKIEYFNHNYDCLNRNKIPKEDLLI